MKRSNQRYPVCSSHYYEAVTYPLDVPLTPAWRLKFEMFRIWLRTVPKRIRYTLRRRR